MRVAHLVVLHPVAGPAESVREAVTTETPAHPTATSFGVLFLCAVAPRLSHAYSLIQDNNPVKDKKKTRPQSVCGRALPSMLRGYVILLLQLVNHFFPRIAFGFDVEA